MHGLAAGSSVRERRVSGIPGPVGPPWNGATTLSCQQTCMEPSPSLPDRPAWPPRAPSVHSPSFTPVSLLPLPAVPVPVVHLHLDGPRKQTAKNPG